MHRRLFTTASRQGPMELKEAVRRLNELAPLSLAGSWDNVGLLVEPPSKETVSKVLLTNDLTTEVLDECITLKADFILSYHPPIFKPLQRITRSHWKELIVGRCLEAGIAIYSPHTAYDALQGGVNDWLVSAFGEARVTPVEQTHVAPQHSHQIKLFAEDPAPLQAALAGLSEVAPEAQVLPKKKSPEVILCNQRDLTACVAQLSSVSERDFRFVISKCEDGPKVNYGMGRYAAPLSHVTIKDVIQKLKAMTNLAYVRLALGVGHTQDTVIVKGAVCAGSGVSVLRGVHATLLVTGEMSHHEVLEFAQTGRSVVLLEHSNSERGFLSEVLQPKLTQLFEGQVKVVVSQDDRDPLQIV